MNSPTKHLAAAVFAITLAIFTVSELRAQLNDPVVVSYTLPADLNFTSQCLQVAKLPSGWNTGRSCIIKVAMGETTTNSGRSEEVYSVSSSYAHNDYRTITIRKLGGYAWSNGGEQGYELKGYTYQNDVYLVLQGRVANATFPSGTVFKITYMGLADGTSEVNTSGSLNTSPAILSLSNTIITTDGNVIPCKFMYEDPELVYYKLPSDLDFNTSALQIGVLPPYWNLGRTCIIKIATPSASGGNGQGEYMFLMNAIYSQHGSPGMISIRKLAGGNWGTVSDNYDLKGYTDAQHNTYLVFQAKTTSGQPTFASGKAFKVTYMGLLNGAADNDAQGVFDRKPAIVSLASAPVDGATQIIPCIDGYSDQSWTLKGNTASSSAFLGTINSQPLIFKVNGATALTIADGTEKNAFFENKIGIGPNVSVTGIPYKDEIFVRSTKSSDDGFTNIRFDNAGVFPNNANAVFGLTDFGHSSPVGGGTALLSNYGGNVLIQTETDKDIMFRTNTISSTADRIIIKNNGNVGIGTSSPSTKLEVGGNTRINGTLCADEVRVALNIGQCWPDYVFSSGYSLPPLDEVESHIKDKHHLPGIPSAAEVEAAGVNIGEMQAKLLQKLEEMTLYIIEQDKRLKVLESENKSLRRGK